MMLPAVPETYFVIILGKGLSGLWHPYSSSKNVRGCIKGRTSTNTIKLTTPMYSYTLQNKRQGLEMKRHLLATTCFIQINSVVPLPFRVWVTLSKTRTLPCKAIPLSMSSHYSRIPPRTSAPTTLVARTMCAAQGPSHYLKNQMRTR